MKRLLTVLLASLLLSPIAAQDRTEGRKRPFSGTFTATGDNAIARADELRTSASNAKNFKTYVDEGRPKVVFHNVAVASAFNLIDTSDDDIHVVNINGQLSYQGISYQSGDVLIWDAARSDWQEVVSSTEGIVRLYEAITATAGNATQFNAVSTSQRNAVFLKITGSFTVGGVDYTPGQVYVLNTSLNQWQHLFTPGTGGGGLTQAQVDARVEAGVEDWAEEGNTDAIPGSKLTNAPPGGVDNVARQDAGNALSQATDNQIKLSAYPSNSALAGAARVQAVQLAAQYTVALWNETAFDANSIPSGTVMLTNKDGDHGIAIRLRSADHEVGEIYLSASTSSLSGIVVGLHQDDQSPSMRQGGTLRDVTRRVVSGNADVFYVRYTRTANESLSANTNVTVRFGSIIQKDLGALGTRIDGLSPVSGFTYPVPTAGIVNGAVTGPKIANGAITTSHIQDGTVSPQKLNSTAEASLLPPSCTAGQIAKRNVGNTAWVCATDSEGSGVGGAINADSILDLAKASRVAGDRGKALGTSATDQDALALLPIPTLAASSGNVPIQPTTSLGNAGAGTAAARWDHRHPLPANVTTSTSGLMTPQHKTKVDRLPVIPSSAGSYLVQVPASGSPTWAVHSEGTSSGSDSSVGRFTRTDIPAAATGMSFRIAGRYGATGVARSAMPSLNGGDYRVDYRDAHGQLFVLGGTATTNFNVSLADLIGIAEEGGAVAAVTGTRFYIQNNRTSGNVTFSGGGIAVIRPSNTEGGATVAPGHVAQIDLNPIMDGVTRKYELLVNAFTPRGVKNREIAELMNIIITPTVVHYTAGRLQAALANRDFTVIVGNPNAFGKDVWYEVVWSGNIVHPRTAWATLALPPDGGGGTLFTLSSTEATSLEATYTRAGAAKSDVRIQFYDQAVGGLWIAQIRLRVEIVEVADPSRTWSQVATVAAGNRNDNIAISTGWTAPTNGTVSIRIAQTGFAVVGMADLARQVPTEVVNAGQDIGVQATEISIPLMDNMGNWSYAYLAKTAANLLLVQFSNATYQDSALTIHYIAH